MSPLTEPLVVLVTTSSAAEAEEIADRLVGERLAACVTIVPRARSVYRWQGRVERADELLLVVKTDRRELAAVTDRVIVLHSAAVPEVIALPIVGGSVAYLEWLDGQLGTAADSRG